MSGSVMSKRFAFWSAVILTAVAFITYQPGYRIGFLDGWWYLEWVGTMDIPRYLIQFFDPRNVTQGYRPMQGLYVLVQYLLFGLNPDGYHLSHILLHAANGILLFFIVERLGKRWRLAFLAALIYTVSPVYSLAIFWHAVVDPLSAFFYLLTVLLWTEYLATQRTIWWVFTFVAFVLALFSKEVAVFLPFFLFLIERWFFHRRPDWHTVARQYVPMLALFLPYVALELNVQSHGEFVGQFKFSIGPHILTNLMPYLAVLAFPWTADMPTGALYYGWLAIVALAYLGLLVYKRSAALLFLGMVAVLNIAPLLGFPLDYYNTRYLYTSSMVSAILIAWLVEQVHKRIGYVRTLRLLASLAVVGVVVFSSARVADAAGVLAEFTRQIRVPFRDISRQHPTFPPDTYLYFVYSPNTPLVDFEGLFFVRYGTGVKVDGTETSRHPELREHNAAFVYYFDSSARPMEIAVDRTISVSSSPPLPSVFEASIRLENVQIPSATARRGEALVAIPEWSVATPVATDYTLFARLLDADGKIVSEFDGPPRRGSDPTSTWKRGQLIVDPLILPIETDAPLGDHFRLEFGIYDPATMQRLQVVDARGQPVTDTVRIEPIRIVPQEAK